MEAESRKCLLKRLLKPAETSAETCAQCKFEALAYMFFELSSLLWMAAVASNAHFVLLNSGLSTNPRCTALQHRPMTSAPLFCVMAGPKGIVSKRGKELKYHM